jgi:hypothetical protein
MRECLTESPSYRGFFAAADHGDFRR